MEKLEPILKQKFWILLGIGILMTITGWWMATGSLAATIKARTELVENAYKNIPTGEIPNTDWSQKLAAINTEQDRAVKFTAAWLWEQQKSRMAWPESVAPHAWLNGYRGDIPLTGREVYRTAYGRDVRRVWETVRPFMPLNGTGIVVYGKDEKILPQKTWGSLAPSAAEMWDAQEDLWLIESLFKTIVDINGGPDASRADAFIHAIENFKLVGGVPAAQRKSAAPAGPGGAAGAMMSPGGGHGSSGSSAASATFGGGGEMGGPQRPGAAGGITSSEFDVKDEFGDDGAGRGGSGGMAGGAMATMTSTPGAAHGPGGGPGSGPGAGGAAANTVRRYIEDDAALPYKTRGFYMTLIMDHRKIPGLIAELSANGKSPWPIEIVRVQMVRLHDNDVDSRGTGGMGGGNYGSGSGGSGFSLSSINTSGSGASGGPGGFPGSSGFSANQPSYDTAGAGFGAAGGLDSTTTVNPAVLSQAAAALAGLEGALQDPFMARVSICGIITLYKEVKPEPVVVAPGAPAQPAATQPAAVPAATPAESTEPPADGTATPADTPAATPDSPEPTTPGEAAPAAAKPSEAKPETPANEAAPVKPAPNGAAPAATSPEAPKAAASPDNR